MWNIPTAHVLNMYPIGGTTLETSGAGSRWRKKITAFEGSAGPWAWREIWRKWSQIISSSEDFFLERLDMKIWTLWNPLLRNSLSKLCQWKQHCL
jgi:hypothetical protein